MQTEQLPCSGNELQSLVLHKQLHLKIKDKNKCTHVTRTGKNAHTHTHSISTYIHFDGRYRHIRMYVRNTLPDGMYKISRLTSKRLKPLTHGKM